MSEILRIRLSAQIPERWCSENGIPVPAFPRTSGTRLLHKYHNTVQNHRRRFRGDVRLLTVVVCFCAQDVIDMA